MAIGIFSLSALQNLPFDTLLISQLCSIELLIVWIYIAAYYLICYFKGNFSLLTQHTNDRFGVGTWVAACAIVPIVFLKDFPSFLILIGVMTLFALILWIIYLELIVKNYWRIFLKKAKSHTGVNLLSTVSTQSIVILLNLLFPGYIPKLINQGLILIGGLFYVIGLIAILHYYTTIKSYRIFIGWNNTNSIIHGAVSITGLASITTNAFSHHILILIWILATCFFILVEGISLIKLYLRIKAAGISKGAFTYNVSQWSRNFTYGMYYAYSLALLDNHLLQNKLIELVVQYGQFIVLALLLIEIILFFRGDSSQI